MTRKLLIPAMREADPSINSDAEADRMIDAVIGGIQHVTESDEKVVLRNFGCFEVKTRAARKGRHPTTGDTIEIPARAELTFKASR